MALYTYGLQSYGRYIVMAPWDRGCCCGVALRVDEPRVQPGPVEVDREDRVGLPVAALQQSEPLGLGAHHDVAQPRRERLHPLPKLLLVEARGPRAGHPSRKKNSYDPT